MNYWVVKGKREQTDWDSFLRPGRTGTWHTKKPPSEWSAGDRFFFWMAYPDSCVIGLGERRGVRGPDEDGEHYFRAHVLAGPLPNPPHQDEMRAMPGLGEEAFLKPGPAGTVFGISEESAEQLFALVARLNPEVDLPEWFDVSDTGKPGTSRQGLGIGRTGGSGSGEPSGARLAEAEERLLKEGAFTLESAEDAREKVYASVVRRRGQSVFRQQLLDAYEGRCAISGCDVEAILEAAHIVPYNGPETNVVQNGLLLRADLHTLFDLGLLTITPDYQVLLAPELLASQYAKLDGRKLQLPSDARVWPSPQALSTRMPAPVPELERRTGG